MIFSKKNEIKQKSIPDINIEIPARLILIPDAFIAVISLFFCSALKVNIVAIKIDIGNAILIKYGTV